MLKAPLLVITEDEAKVLADAIADVAKAYDFDAILDPKTQATIHLVTAMGTVYGARIVTVMSRPSKKQMQQTIPFPSGGVMQ